MVAWSRLFNRFARFTSLLHDLWALGLALVCLAVLTVALGREHPLVALLIAAIGLAAWIDWRLGRASGRYSARLTNEKGRSLNASKRPWTR